MKTKHLTCGCCGIWFKTWPEYIDQDQDKGYGICKSCQGWIEEKEEKEFIKARGLLAGALNEENRERFLSSSISIQKHIILRAIEDKILVYRIEGQTG